MGGPGVVEDGDLVSGCAGVEYIGGPADGRLEVVEADDEGWPPKVRTLQVVPALRYGQGSPDEVIRLVPFTYRRRVNPTNHGEHWQYVYEPTDRT